MNYDKRSLGPLLALAAVMLLASVLRFYGLEIQSLRFDELETWRYAIKSPPGILEATGVSGSDPHPPGYYLFIHYWMQLAGDAEWALRLPSAVAGVLSVLVTFLLGRRLYSAREGLIAALLMTVLWAPIYYSQEARAYSLYLGFGRSQCGHDGRDRPIPPWSELRRDRPKARVVAPLERR